MAAQGQARGQSGARTVDRGGPELPYSLPAWCRLGRRDLMRAAAFLRNVPVLAGLSEELLERLADDVEEVRVRAGDWIMREGEAADSAFIVRSGRVEVIDERPPE